MAEVTQSPPKHHKTDGNAGFLRAARDGNLDEVLDYLKGSTDINTSNPNGLNALHLASKEGHINIVTELLNRGANVEAATKKGNTALHIASLAGHEDIVRKLVERGAQVNLQAQAGFTPLYMASQEGHAEVVKFLLSSGANQGLSTEDGFTPLAVALQQGHDKVVSVLLEHDAKGKVRLPALHIAAKKDDVKSAALLLQNEQNSVELQTKGGLVNDTTKSGFTPLHIAAHYGNTNVANLLIQRNADVNFRAKNNITPLHVGSRWGKLNMVNLLLDNNATIDEKTRDGLTPLHCAARSGHDSVVDTLLERGAPHSAKTKNGLTPLHMAAQGDHEDCARLLLYHKASLNEVTVDYLTPLHVAAHCGNVKTAKLLLDRKCEPNARALNGFTPLHIACKKNRIKVVELLLKYGASIETKTESGLTPLHVASFMGHMNIVIYLIQHNANPNTATVRGETSLHLAARANQSDIIRILLRNGATVDARAREQQTPLHIAARLGNVDNVVLLLQHGAQVDATTKDKYTPLHIAAKEGHDEVAQVLLENEAQHDITTKKGFTPLHIAAKYGNIKVARLLLQKEANPDAQGKNGLTPLHVATHYNHANVAQLLLENKANPHATAKNGYTPLHIAAKKNQMDIATMLLEYGAKPNAESKNGFTPLHLAAQEGHTDIVSLLLEKQANVNAKAHNGLTPMHLAAQEDRVPVAEILCKYGAETDTSTKAGYTPLHTACHFGQVNMVRFLLDHEASVNATTKVGYTPLHQAAQQGHVQVVSTLLKNQASPNAVTNNGQTPLAIAQKLGYISVVEILKPVTEVQGISPATEDKYKVVSPETMQETFISDSEDEGADDFLPQSPIFGKPISEQHVYLPYYEGQKMTNREDSVSLERGGSASPLDTSFDKDYMDAQITSQSFQGVYSAAPPTAGRLPVGTETNRFSSYSGSSFSTSFDPDNVPVDRSPVYSGKLNWKSFLISFMVDARGGAMRGCRHPGVRIIIPPRKCSMPTRITCRLVKKEKLTKPPPMLEGEGLAARVLEMGPVGTKFLGPVLLEVPHFASLRGKEREVVILRTDNGESWYEHPMQATEDAVAEALGSSAEELDSEEDLSKKRIKRILTTDLPMYFALVSRVTRVKQESTVIGMEGGVLSSNVVPQVQAVLPEGTLTRPIPVGLQAQPIAPELVAKLLGNRVAVSPIVTIEPRRRKFHKPITLTIPVPRAAQKGMINQYGGERPTLRLLFSLAGNNSHGRADPNPASWEDVTDTKPMTLQDDCVSFTTTVSARFWLIDCQNVAEAAQMASVLYQEAVTVPYMAKFVVYAKRDSPEEGKLRIFCMTDDKDDKTLEKQEKFFEVARSRDIEVLEGRPQFVEMAGNLIPVTKSGDQLHVNFRAFRENRLPCTVKVRDQDQEASARVAFMKEPKVARGEAPQTPICNLNIRLPDMVLSESGELDTDKAAEIRKRHDFLRGQGLVIQDSVNRSEMKLSDIADTVQGDWVVLAQQLHISISDINHFKNDYKTVGDQALAMLHFWVEKNGDKATGNQLENALRRINREDVVRKCMYNTERVDDELEAAAARVAMDQSGFDTFKEEVGITKDSMKRGMSLDVQYDEQDMIKESESATEESPTGDRGEPVPSGYRPPQVTVVSAGPATTEDEDDWIQAARDMRRPVAEPHKSPQEDEEESRRRKEAFLDLAQQMDKFAELEDAQRLSQDADDTSAHSVSEEEIVRSAKTSPSEAFPALRQGVSSVQYSQQQQVQQESRPVERPRVTFSDEADTIRRGEQSEEGYGQDDEEVLTPPPSPTEKFDTEEPVLAAESSVAAAASRLASEAAEEQADSGDDTAGLGVDEAAYKDKGQDVYKMEVEEEEEEKERVMEQLDLSQTTTEEVQYVEAEIRIEEDYREGAAEYSVSVSQEVTETFAGEEVTPLEVEQAREAAVVTEEVDAVQVPGEEIATQEIVQEEVVSRSEEDKLIEEQVTTQFSSVVVSSGVSQIETHYDFEEAEECQARQVAEEMAQAESVTVVHSAEQIHAAESMVYAAPDESSELHEESAESQPEEDVVPVVATEVEAESPITDIKYSSLTDPSTTQMVRETIESIEEVVTSMERKFEKSTTEKFESTTYTEKLSTEDDGHGSGRTEDVLDFEMVREEFRSEVTEDASETTQDFSEIRSELVESMESQQDLDSRRTSDIRMEAESDFFVKDRGETPVLQREEEETDVTRTAQVEEEHVRHERISESSVVEDRDEDRFDARAEADLSIQESLTRVVHSDVRYQVARESEEICETAHLVHTETQDTDMVAVVRGEEEITEVYMTKEERYEEDGEEIEAAVGGEDVVEEETESQELDEEILQFEREEREVERELRMEEETEMIEKESEETEVDREIREERIELETERTEEEEVLYREEKRELETEERKLETMEKEEERELETEEKEEERELETEERDEGELEALEREKEERELGIEEKEEERELATEEKEEKRELETEEKEEERKLEALEREEEERELEIEEKEEERELEEREEERELETEEQEEARELETEEREDERELETEEKEDREVEAEEREEREIAVSEKDTDKELVEEKEDERELEMEEKEDEREVAVDSREERELVVHGTEERTLEIKSEEEDRELMFDEEDQPAQAEDVISAQSMAYVESSVSCLPDEEEKEIEDTGVEETVTVSKRQTTQAQLDNRTSQETETLETREEAQFTSHTLSQYVFEEGQSYYREERTDTESVQRADDEVDTVYHREVLESTQTTIATLPDEEEKEIQDDGTDRPDGTEYVLSMETTAETPHMFDKEVYESDDDDWELLDKKDLTQEEVAQAEQLTMESTVDTRDFSDSDLEHTKHERVDWTYGDQATEEEKEGEKEEEISDEDIEEKSVSPTQEVMTRKEMVGSEEMLAAASQVIDMAAVDGHVPYSGSSGQISEAEMVSMPEEETGFQVDAINIGVVEEAQDEMEGTAVEVEVRRFSEPDQSEMIGEVLVQDSEIQSKGEVHITHEILAEISVSAVEVEEAKEEEHISEFDMIRERIQVEEETEMRETVEITSPSEVSVPGFADGDLSPTVECQAAEFSVIQSDQAFSEEVEALSEAVAVTVVSQASVSEATTQHVHEESYTTSIQQTFEETREGTETLFADSTVVISKTDVGGETMLMEEEEREDYSPSDTSLPQEAEEAEDDSEEEEEEEADKDVDAELEQEIEEQDRLTAALAHVQDKSDEEDQEEYEQESPTSGPCQEESGPDVVRLTTETSLDQITEQSGESELSKSQELPEFSAEGEQGKSEEDKDQIVRDSLDQDYKETPSTEEGEYSMKTEPSLKEVKEEDYAEDKSEVRDEEEVLEDEDVDEAFEKYEGEPEVVVPLDAKIGEHVESFEEDIDRAFERYEHERTTSEYVEEVSETLQVTEDVDQEQAELQEERPTETVDGSTEQEVVEKAEDADQESEMVTGTVREQVQESRQVEDYEMELSKAIVEEALQTSLETQKKLDTDDDKQEEEEEEARRPSGIMAEMQFLEEQQTKDEMMSDDDLDDNEYEEEEDKADVIAKKLEEGDQPVDEEEDEEEADMRQEPFVDRLESKIEKAESAVVDVSITQEVEHSVDRTETKLELSQSSEIVKEMERSVDRVEIFTLDEKAGFVSQKEEAGTVMTGEEEVTPADDEIVVFIDRREEFIEILPDTVRPDDDNEEKIASFQTSDRTSKEPETSMGAGGDVSSSGEQKAEGPSQQQQAPSDHSTAAFHVQMSFQSAGTTDAEELTSPGNLEEEIIEMEKKLNQMKEIVGEESQEEEFVEAKTSLSPPQDQDAAKEEEKRQMFMASSISGSDYTSPSDVEYAQSGTTGSGSYYTAQSDVMSSSSYTAPSETMTGSEYTMTASEHEHEADEEYESEGRISTDISQQIYIEHKVGRQSERREETTSSSESEAEDEMDRLDRPPSPSEFTLIASQDQERLNISLGLTSKAETYTHTRYSERTGGSSFASRWEQTTQHGLYVQRDSDIERDSLQEDEEEDNADEEEEEEDEGEAGRMSVDEAGGERPPSPSDFTLIASQDQESLQLILGQEEVPEQETGSPMQWEQDLEKVMTDPDAQSTASSDAALMIGLDRMSVTGTDNNTMSGFSSESGHQVDTSDSPKDQCYPESSGGEELDDRQDLYQAYLKEVEAAGEEEKARSSGLSEGEDQPEAVHTGLEQAEIDEELDSNEPASLSQTNEEITSYDLQAETAHIEGALASKEESKDTLSSDAEHISPQAHFDDIVHDDERGGEESRNLELEEMVHGSEEEKVMAMRGERGKFTFSLEEQRKSSYTDQEEEVQMDEERSEHAQSQGKGEGRVHFSHYFEEEMKVGSSSYGEQVESRSEHKSSYSSTQWEFGVRQHVEETSDLPRHAQEEEKEEEEEGEEVGDLAAAMGGQAVDKMSSSSSEVAQLDDFDDQGIHGVEQAGTSDEEGAHEADEPSSPGAQGDEDVLTHRVMMKKEVHKKTTVGLDGQEETTVREDSQIQQDNEPPEELRESMQEIINQFMETDPQPAALPPSQSLEDDV